MVHPTPDQLALLHGFERIAFHLADQVNRRSALKRAAHLFLRTVGASWVHHCSKHLQHVIDLEHLTALRPDRGVLLVSNHRSFFDMYLISSVVLRHTDWVQRMYFPVRSEFFYERPLGVLVNAIMSALAMYPPVLRQPPRRAFNQYTVDFLSEVLQRPGTLVGFHPEGTRNKTDDPYTLLPANPGVGQIVHRARPIVLPAFVLGLTNDFVHQVRSNFDGTGQPITLVFGPPMDLSRYYSEPARLRTYKRIADHIREEIARLGAIERDYRHRHGLPSLSPECSPAPDAGDTASRAA